MSGDPGTGTITGEQPTRATGIAYPSGCGAGTAAAFPEFGTPAPGWQQDDCEHPAEEQAHVAAAGSGRAEDTEGPRCSRGSWKVLTKVSRAADARIAPNAPCRVRAATNIPNEPAAEETANTARPVMKTTCG